MLLQKHPCTPKNPDYFRITNTEKPNPLRFGFLLSILVQQENV